MSFSLFTKCFFQCKFIVTCRNLLIKNSIYTITFTATIAILLRLILNFQGLDLLLDLLGQQNYWNLITVTQRQGVYKLGPSIVNCFVCVSDDDF